MTIILGKLLTTPVALMNAYAVQNFTVLGRNVSLPNVDFSKFGRSELFAVPEIL